MFSSLFSQAMAADKNVDLLSFTGSTPVRFYLLSYRIQCLINSCAVLPIPYNTFTIVNVKATGVNCVNIRFTSQ